MSARAWYFDDESAEYEPIARATWEEVGLAVERITVGELKRRPQSPVYHALADILDRLADDTELFVQVPS